MIFWVQKIIQWDKHSLLHIIAQEPYIIWLSFVVDKCKIIISSGILFLFFQNLDFSGCYEGQRAKNGPNWQNLSVVPWCLRDHTSHDLHLRAHAYKGNISRIFLYFFQILIFGFNNWVKRQKMAQNDIKLCLLHSISQEAYIIW